MPSYKSQYKIEQSTHNAMTLYAVKTHQALKVMLFLFEKRLLCFINNLSKLCTADGAPYFRLAGSGGLAFKVITPIIFQQSLPKDCSGYNLSLLLSEAAELLPY